MDDVKIVAIASYDSIGEAEIVKAMLESNGVNCSLIHEIIQTVLPYLTSGVDPITLVVAEPDAQKALELMNAKFDQADFDELTASKPRKKCGCKS